MGEHPSRSSVTHTTPGGIPAGDPAPDDARTGTAWAGWRGWAPGTRVVVRRRLAEGGWTDVLGDLLAVGPDGVEVRTRRGDVRVAAADIALGKPVPPAPARRAPRPTGAGPVPDPAPDR